MPRPTLKGWRLPAAERADLLERFPPAYPRLVADHVTGGNGAERLPEARSGRIVGIVDDGAGIEALVVEIGGTTRRPDGSIFHLTWSFDGARGRAPVQSNDVIREKGWRDIVPFVIRLEPDYAD